MRVSKNRVFGSLLSLMVGTAVISFAAPSFAADGDIPVQNIAPLKAAPVSSSQQEALADASDVSELRAALIRKEKELEELKHTLSLQRKQIETSSLYREAQNRHGSKNLNIAQVDFELMKKQEDLERQARGLVQQREWLEKERLRIQKLEQQTAGGSGSNAATTKDLTDAYQKMGALEKRYQTEMAKLVKENKEMQTRITELQSRKPVQTPVHLTTGSRSADDERLKAERKILAIEKRHAAERDELIAVNARMQEQIAALQTAQKAEAEQARSKAVTSEEKQQAEAHIRAMEKRHTAERAQLIAENARMQEKMTALQQAQETAAALAKEKTATEEERRRAEAKLAELQKQHEEERALLNANNRKLQTYLAKLETEKQQEIAKLRTEMEREAAAKADAVKLAENRAATARIVSLQEQHKAEQQKLREENEQMQTRLAGLQKAQQEEAARARSAARTAEELAAAEQRAAALQKQHEEERLKLMRENLAMQERLASLQQAQQQAALEAKQADQSVLAEKARLEKELAALRAQHETERQKLIRDNTAVQQRLAAAEQEKRKLAQETSARIAAEEEKYAVQLAAARAAREKADYIAKRLAAQRDNSDSFAMTRIEPQAGGSGKPSLVVKEMTPEDLAALERSYNPGAAPSPAPHPSQNNRPDSSLPAPVTTQAAKTQAAKTQTGQTGQYIPHYELAVTDSMPENTVTRPEPSISTHMPYATENAVPAAAANPVPDDAYRNFLDGIMAVHRGESPSLNAPTPSSVIAERKKRAYEAAQAVHMPQSRTTVYAEHPVMQQQQPPQYHDLGAPAAHMPQQRQVIQAQPATPQQQAAPLPAYGSAAAEQPLSGLLKKSGIAPENAQLSDDGYMLKWSAGVANGLFEQQSWPQYKNANPRDLAAQYVARYNQDCENKLRVLSDQAVDAAIQSVRTFCPVQGNNYEAVFVFYAVPQHSFSAIVHVAQPAYSSQLQSLTAGLVPALQSLSGASVRIDHIPAQLSGNQGTVIIQ